MLCFGPFDQEWQEREKYCKYKAGTILKALKAGQQPERGNPFAPPEEEDAKAEEDPTPEMAGMGLSDNPYHASQAPPVY